MRALLIIIPIYILLFIFYGARNLKGFLLLTGIMTMPFRTDYTFVSVGPYTGWINGIVISLSEISFILLFVYLIVNTKRSKKPSKIITPIILFFGACTLSIINSTWLRISLFQIIFILKLAFLYYYVLLNSLESEKDLRLVVLFLIVSLLFQSSIALAQVVTGNTLDFFSTGRRIDEFVTIGEDTGITRAVGTLGRPNALAMYIVPLLLLSISICWGRKIFRKIGLIATVLGSLALLFSFSRGGWLSFIIALLFLFYFMFRRRIISLGTVVIIILVPLLVAAIFFTDIQKRIYGDDRNAASSRIPLIKIAFNMIRAHPIIGVGVNTFRDVIHSYATTPDLQHIYLNVVHNEYLLIFAETGVLGLITFLWFIVSLFRESLKCAKNRENLFVQAIGIGITAGLIAICVHQMVDFVYLNMIFFLPALCTAANKLVVKEEAVS